MQHIKKDTYEYVGNIRLNQFVDLKDPGTPPGFIVFRPLKGERIIAFS